MVTRHAWTSSCNRKLNETGKNIDKIEWNLNQIKVKSKRNKLNNGEYNII